MFEDKKDQRPVLRFSLNGTAVTVMFSNAGEPDMKTKIRDILMESFEEHFMEKMQAYIQ